jgi:predicted metal-dependent hydrolase
MDADFDREVQAAIGKGVELFNSGLYWETHEVLEKVWLRDTPPRKKFLHGLIKIAVGYHHFKNGKHSSMLHMLVAGRELLLPFSPTYMGLDVGDLLAATEADSEWARKALSGEADLEPVTPPRLTLLMSHP